MSTTPVGSSTKRPDSYQLAHASPPEFFSPFRSAPSECLNWKDCFCRGSPTTKTFEMHVGSSTDPPMTLAPPVSDGIRDKSHRVYLSLRGFRLKIICSMTSPSFEVPARVVPANLVCTKVWKRNIGSAMPSVPTIHTLKMDLLAADTTSSAVYVRLRIAYSWSVFNTIIQCASNVIAF